MLIREKYIEVVYDRASSFVVSVRLSGKPSVPSRVGGFFFLAIASSPRRQRWTARRSVAPQAALCGEFPKEPGTSRRQRQQVDTTPGPRAARIATRLGFS